MKIILPVIALILFGLIIFLSQSAVRSLTNVATMDETVIIKVILLVLFANASLFTTVVMTFFIIMSPERTAIEKTLYWFPVRTYQRKLGFYLPLFITVLLVNIIIFVPILITFSANVGFSIGLTILVIACFFLQIATIECGNLFFFESFSYLFRILRITGMTNKLLSISASGFIFLFVFISFAHLQKIFALIKGISFNSLNFALIHLGYFLPSFHLQHMPLQVMDWTLLPIVILACFLLSTWLPRNLSEQNGIALLKSIPFSNNFFLSIMIKEWKDMLRHPDIFMMLIIYLAVTIFVGLKMELGTYLSIATLFLWILMGLLSYSSFGRDEKIRWMVHIYPHSSATWMMAKLIANLIFTLLIGMVFIMILLLFQHGPLNLIYIYMPVGILVTCVCFLAGILFPYSEDHPYATAFSSIFVCLIGLPMLFLGAKVMSNLDNLTTYLILGLTTLLVIVLIFLAEGWRYVRDH